MEWLIHPVRSIRWLMVYGRCCPPLFNRQKPNFFHPFRVENRIILQMARWTFLRDSGVFGVCSRPFTVLPFLARYQFYWSFVGLEYSFENCRFNLCFGIFYEIINQLHTTHLKECIRSIITMFVILLLMVSGSPTS